MKKIYFFGNGQADGSAKDKNNLGGKGANLAEMTKLNIPVPPGFTINTDVCLYYLKNNHFPINMEGEIKSAIQKTESIMQQKFGNTDNPLLLSVRSGARQSMPGMMETVLNIGLTSQTIPGLINKTNDSRFVYDAYRRLITMYADVVMEKASGINPVEGLGIRAILEKELDELKLKKKIKFDFELPAQDVKKLCEQYKQIIFLQLKKEFPDDPFEQYGEQ